MRPTKLLLHHSATVDSETFSWSAIRRFHESYAYEGVTLSYEEAIKLIGQGKNVKRPWKAIGYHFGIEKVNEYYEIMFGRFPYEKGAHEKTMNHCSIGLCFVGNFDLVLPPKEQWDLGIKLVSWLCFRYGLKREDVYGHRDFNKSKTCPGLMFDVEKFRKELVLKEDK